ncbi:MAG TPA: glycosyltransferase family 2 protein [Acidimicrobiales bacterium]|nr:glycosyltransferase family 2 protein [Acidimicrobiales bacterium]
MGDTAKLSADEEEARSRFHAEYPSPEPAELGIVIAAYNEEANVGDVLKAIPPVVSGLRTVTIVVDDGSADGTFEAARKHPNALVAQLRRNRGQGVALRLGYALARDVGVTYIATLDADGQYPPSDLPAVLGPLLDDTADFVTGSRKLGSAEAPTLIRRIGTVVFARLMSMLVGQRITDTSNALRAMRAEITGKVILEQPQYQSAELMIGVLAGGWRVAEVPTVIRRRASGKSKKGPPWLYGYHYATVVVGTWLRERRRRGSGAAPAGQG